MKIIGFTGTMGSGKSTAIDYLRHTAGQLVINVKFAQPLYDIQEYVYNRIDKAYKRPNSFTKDRKLLQWLGTEWGRDTLSQSLWIDLWKAEVEEAIKKYPHAIITVDDVRFDNEAYLLQEMGGYLVKLTSNRGDSRIDTKSGIVSHKSEEGIGNNFIDFQIDNSSTMEDFKSSLHSVFNTILTGRND